MFVSKYIFNEVLNSEEFILKPHQTLEKEKRINTNESDPLLKSWKKCLKHPSTDKNKVLFARQFLLSAHPQNGKTGAFIWAIKRFLQKYNALSADFANEQDLRMEIDENYDKTINSDNENHLLPYSDHRQRDHFKEMLYEFRNLDSTVLHAKLNSSHGMDFEGFHAKLKARNKLMKLNGVKLTHEIVIEKIEKFLKDNPNRKDTVQIVDMGCGTAEIAQHFHGRPLLKILNVDHKRTQFVPEHIEIIEMDMSTISQKYEPKSFDFMIFSLSLWGTKENIKKYLTEARKVIKDSGEVIIIENKNNKINNDDNLINILREDELFSHRIINKDKYRLDDKYSLMIFTPVND